MSVMTIGGICIAIILVMLFLAFLVFGAVVVVMAFFRSKSKGVKFSDGVNTEEWAKVQEAVAETIRSDELIESLKAINNAVTKTIQKKAVD